MSKKTIVMVFVVFALLASAFPTFAAPPLPADECTAIGGYYTPWGECVVKNRANLENGVQALGQGAFTVQVPYGGGVVYFTANACVENKCKVSYRPGGPGDNASDKGWRDLGDYGALYNWTSNTIYVNTFTHDGKKGIAADTAVYKVCFNLDKEGRYTIFRRYGGPTRDGEWREVVSNINNNMQCTVAAGPGWFALAIAK